MIAEAAIPCMGRDREFTILTLGLMQREENMYKRIREYKSNTVVRYNNSSIILLFRRLYVLTVSVRWLRQLVLFL